MQIVDSFSFFFFFPLQQSQCIFPLIRSVCTICQLSFLSEQSKLGTNLMNEDLFQHVYGGLNAYIESLLPFGGGCMAKVEFMHWVCFANNW